MQRRNPEKHDPKAKKDLDEDLAGRHFEGFHDLLKERRGMRGVEIDRGGEDLPREAGLRGQAMGQRQRLGRGLGEGRQRPRRKLV